jgi:hypothetical protein
LWSVDFFRCESILLKSYWIMVVMDVFTRRIIGLWRRGGGSRRSRHLPDVQSRDREADTAEIPFFRS